MVRVLGRYSTYIYALLRIVAGLVYVLHGTQKLFNFPPAKAVTPLSGLMMTAGIIELVCGLLVLIGLYASIAAFIASGEMAVAYFMAHQPAGALPIQNGGELAALLAFVFLFIAARGSGVWSIDSAFRGTSDGT
jgi:Predicted membrane protein